MGNLALVKSEFFGAVKCDIYQNNQNELFMTVNQLAKGLGYASKKGIENILTRNEYLRRPEFSTTHNLRVVEGNREVTRDVILFTEDGIYEVAFKSDAPKAQEFRSWVRGVIKELRQEIQVQNTALNDGKEVKPTDMFDTFFKNQTPIQQPIIQQTSKSGIEVLVDLFNQNSARLPQPEFESSYAYLWHALTVDIPSTSITPASVVPTTPMIAATPNHKYMATNAIADNAFQIIKDFIKKHPRSFEPRYGFIDPDYIYIRSSLFDKLIGHHRKAVLNNWADRGWIKFRVYPDYRDFTRKRVDRYLHKHSNYIAIKAQILK